MALAAAPRIQSVSLHGVRVDRVTMAETLELIDGFIRSGRPHHIVTLDASMCVFSRDDAELRRIVGSAELVTPDSAGVLWACKSYGCPLAGRVSGVEIVDQLCRLSPERGYRLFFFGSAPGVAEDAAEKFRARYPGVHIVGTRDGFFGPDDEPAIIDEIRSSQPDILCVALGIPKQEKWIASYRDELGVPVLIGVGGTFDVHSGRVKRAPMWMQRLSLEWLYRLGKNPRKIGKVMTLPKFMLMTLRSKPRR
jgi:N-acetylglucosaminyldiphosphoundecaprenol N-acetyl-beta-D-mannosaminyltransferase